MKEVDGLKKGLDSNDDDDLKKAMSENKENELKKSQKKPERNMGISGMGTESPWH